MEEETGTDPLKQFLWVNEWLTKHNLYKTLDTLLDEYPEVVSSVGLSLNKDPSLSPKTPISELKSTLTFHKSSILSVRFHPTRPWLLSTDSQKNLTISSYLDGSVLTMDRTNNPFMGSIISVDINPIHPHLLLIGTMDDRHALLEITEPTGEDNYKISTLKMWNAHRKYVIRVKWAPTGDQFVTASHDSTVLFYKLTEDKKSADQVKQMCFNGCVEAAEYTSDGKHVVISVRGDCCLHYINTETYEVSLANTNLLGDDYVSFTVLDLKRSPDQKTIMASTDHSRSILFQQGSPLQVRNFYGFENDGFSQPRVTFDNQGCVYLTSQDNKVYVFDTSTGRLLTKFDAHTGVVRDIDYLAEHDLLVTCSYDKTIKLWQRKHL